MGPKQQRVARFLMDHEPAVAFLSASGLGERVGADAATVVRFARAVGFRGYEHLQETVRRRLPRYPTFLEKIEHDGTPGSDESVLRRAFAQDAENLRRALATVDRSVFSAAVDALGASRRILVVGGGVSQAPASYLVSSLRMIGLDIREAAPGIPQAHELAQLEPSDLVVGIGFFRYLRTTASALRRAAERGARRIAVTDSPLSPLAAIADHALVVPVESTSHRISLAAVMALLHALVAAVSARRHDEATRSLRRVDEEYRASELVLAE